MKRVKGYRLVVELNASQVRRRLRGHGFGVRKVESAGSNRAVIIHTATGDHLRELEGLFRDVTAVIIDEIELEETERPADPWPTPGKS